MCEISRDVFDELWRFELNDDGKFFNQDRMNKLINRFAYDMTLVSKKMLSKKGLYSNLSNSIKDHFYYKKINEICQNWVVMILNMVDKNWRNYSIHKWIGKDNPDMEYILDIIRKFSEIIFIKQTLFTLSNLLQSEKYQVELVEISSILKDLQNLDKQTNVETFW
ncbi:hypothetical protein A3Q56_08696, partial [Intoshia linei]